MFTTLLFVQSLEKTTSGSGRFFSDLCAFLLFHALGNTYGLWITCVSLRTKCARVLH